MRQQCVSLSLNEPPIRARQAGVFPLADFVHPFPQMSQDVELVVQNLGLWGVAFLEGGVAERLPHVHDGQADFAAFFRTEPGEELVETGRRTKWGGRAP